MTDKENVVKVLSAFAKNRICLPQLVPWAEIESAIDLLKQEEALISELKGFINNFSKEAVVQKKGHWIDHDSMGVNVLDSYKCSNCGHVCRYEPNYCSHCGAKMKKSE